MNGVRPTSSVSLRDFLTVIFRRKLPIAVIAIVVSVMTLSLASRVGSVYRGTAKVLIRRIGPSPLATTWTPYYQLEEEMNTEVELVSTDVVLQKALEKLLSKGSVIHIPRRRKVLTFEPTIDDLRAGVSAEAMEMSNILLIHFTGPDPEFVRDAADAVANAYVEHRVELRKASDVHEYFRDQMDQLETRLVGLSQKEMELRKQGGIYDLEWQYRTAINRRTEIEIYLSKVRSRRIAEEKKLALLKERLDDTTSLFNPIPEFDQDELGREMLLDYWKLCRERDAVASTMTSDSPKLKMLDDQIKRTKARFQEELRRRINAKELLLKDLIAEERGYQTEVDMINMQLQSTPDIVAEISHLQREVNYTYKQYEKLVEKYIEAMTSEANDIRLANAKVVSPATVRVTRAGKLQSVYILFSILLGVTLGLGFGFLVENADHSVKSPAEVEEIIGLPLLGSIPDDENLVGISKNLGRG